MNAPRLRLIYQADDPAPAPRPPPLSLASADELETALRRTLHERHDGELTVRGDGTARICVFEGRIAWVRSTDHPEHLGDVMRRELGLPVESLRTAIAHCRTTGQRFGEGLVTLGLVRPRELRDCLRRHISEQLWELLSWRGAMTVEHSAWPHRYDHEYTFEVDELLTSPATPDAAQRERLLDLEQRCRARLPRLQLACVIDVDEGALLHTTTSDEEQRAAEDLVGLCTAGLRRLATNRVVQGDGPPPTMVLSAPDACMVVQQLSWRPDWLLVLGGPDPPGRMLAVADAMTKAEI